MTHESRQKFRDRANRAFRELKKEGITRGHINDGSGRRYRVGVFYLLAGEIEKSADAFNWFYEEFPDDIGEPVFNLYSALCAYRTGQHPIARRRLMEACIGNIYMLPRLIGEDLSVQDIWHSSNWHRKEYLNEVSEFLSEPSQVELQWIASELMTDEFVTLRNGYVSAYRALLCEKDIAKRVVIIAQWNKLQSDLINQAESAITEGEQHDLGG